MLSCGKKVVRTESFYKWAIFHIWYMITMHIASSQSDIYIMPTSKPCVLKPLKSITTASLRLISSNSCTQIYKSFVLSIKKIRVKKKLLLTPFICSICTWTVERSLLSNVLAGWSKYRRRRVVPTNPQGLIISYKTP